jgi:iron(III) transport system ATP-binding protein
LIEGLTKRFAGRPPTVAVDDVGLEIPEGEFLVLLGPSGCGKTTTLRCVAGLESPDEGRVSFGDRVMFDSGRRVNLAPDKRNIGMVFQSYALWPHMTVRKNIGYPLRARKVRGAAAAEMVAETARRERAPDGRDMPPL